MQQKNLAPFRWRPMAPLAVLVTACGAAAGSAAATLTAAAPVQIAPSTSVQPAPLIGAVSAAEIIRTVPAALTVAGRYLPTSGLRVTVPGDFRSSCRAPSGMSPSGFKVVCEFNQPGPQTLRIYSATKLLGSVAVTVKTNVTGVAWTSASMVHSGGVKFGEPVSFRVSGINLLATPSLGLVVEKCTSATSAAGIQSNTLRTFTCTFKNQTSTLAEQLAGVVKDGSTGQVLFNGWTVTVAGRLPDTGVTASQCYGAGLTVAGCTSAAAIAFSSKQDGMIGRDVTHPDSGDGKLGFSYSTVGRYAKTECVKDNITGLMWEGKPTSGPRASTNKYANYGDGRAGDASAYVAAVNATALCGHTDWRLPTVNELQSLVDYGVDIPGPTIDANWFPNTIVQPGAYWTATRQAGAGCSVWNISFDDGMVNTGACSLDFFHVRLVR